MLVDHVDWIDTIAGRLAHLGALVVADKTVPEYVLGRRRAAEMGTEHHHPGDPEEQNVVARYAYYLS